VRTYLRRSRRSFLRLKDRGGRAKNPHSLRNSFVTPSKPHRNSFVATRSLRLSSTLATPKQVAWGGEETRALRNPKAEGRNNSERSPGCALTRVRNILARYQGEYSKPVPGSTRTYPANPVLSELSTLAPIERAIAPII
jgi:hypothetical protein